MSALEYTQLDLIRNKLKICSLRLSRVCDRWSEIGYCANSDSNYTIDVTYLKGAVETTLLAYQKSDISNLSRELSATMESAGKALRVEIKRNLTHCVIDRQEAHYNDQILEFWFELLHMKELVKLYKEAFGIIYRYREELKIEGFRDWSDAAILLRKRYKKADIPSTDLEDLKVDIFCIIDSTITILSVLQPFIKPVDIDKYWKANSINLPYITAERVELTRFGVQDLDAPSIETEFTETGDRKSRKKEQITHKQQMVLVELLGLHTHPFFKELTLKQRGIILGELLNRSVDDTVNMLNPETSKGNDKLNWDNEYNRGQVRQFLQKNGLEL